MRRSVGSLIFTSCLLIFLVLMVVGARDYGFDSWIFPVVVGIPTSALAVFQLVRQIRSSVKAQRQPQSKAGEEEGKSSDTRRLIRYILWTFGFFIAVGLFGFKIGCIMYFLSFLHFEGHTKWWKNMLLTGIAVFLIFQFEVLLSVHWPEGFIGQYVPLPLQ